MVFELNLDYIRSNRGMLVTAETVSNRYIQNKIETGTCSILKLNKYIVFILLLNTFFTLKFFEGFGRNWWHHLFGDLQWVHVILFLVNIFHLRSFSSSQCFECLPSSSCQVLIHDQSGNYNKVLFL